MTQEWEFDGVDRITFGALGPPGHRTFYLQVTQGLETLTLVVEKDHVLALGEGTEEIFKSAGYPEHSIEWDADTMALEEPIEPAFRVGTIAIGYADDRDRVLIECRALVDADAGTEPGTEPGIEPGIELGIELEPDSEREPDDDPDAAPSARFWITRAQLEALSAYGLIVAAQGRPICPLCRVPMEPDGHQCFASNGHRTEA